MSKQLPLSSKADFTNGIWFVFKADKAIVRVWLSLLTGKEIIYVNGDIVSQRRNISSFNTVDSLDHKGDHYDIEIDTESLMPYKINCSVFINGKFEGCHQVTQSESGKMNISDEDGKNSIQRMLERNLLLGKKELDEYDLETAEIHFDKALMLSENNPDIYFHKACISSLNENTHLALEQLEQAIQLGLSGRNRILEEGHFAFVRVTPEFEIFKQKYL